MPGSRPLVPPLSFMSDNIVLLEMSGAEETRRTVRVLKPRGSPHDSRVRPFDIESGGIRID